MVSVGSDGRRFSACMEAVDARGVDALSDRYGGNPLSEPIDQWSESGVGHVHWKCDQRGASGVAFHAARYPLLEMVAAPRAGRTLVDQSSWRPAARGFIRGGDCGVGAFGFV